MQSLSKQRTPRKFFCDFQNCGKSFTRAEHLQRHELNHRDSPNTCARCSAHFARPDLLERHMERHAQKDKEAGGDGLGVLVTRKRCWRDENGNITTKRPASSVAAIGKALEAQKQRRGDSSDEGGPGSCLESTTVPISPPYSSESSGRNRKGNAHDEQTVDDVGFRQPRSEQQLDVRDRCILSDGFLEAPVPQQPEYHLGPTISDITTSALASCQADFDLFSADTAQSFNMPFTTPNNYNWLFEELRVPESGQENISIPFDQNIVMGTNQVNTTIPIELGYDDESQLLPTPSNEHEFLNFGAQTQSQQQQFIQQGFQPLEQLEQRPAEVSLEPHVYFPNGPSNSISPVSEDSRSNATNSASANQQGFRVPENPHPQQPTHVTTPPMRCSHNSPHSSESHYSQTAPTPEISPPPQHALPEIDEVARQQVLELVIQATSSSETGESQLSWDDPLLSLSALQNYSDLFFSRFNLSYPLIHRQSFDPSSVNTLLLVSVLMLGATYGEEDAHQMAVRVHDVLRGVLVSSDYFHATPGLWVLQTVLLIEVFGKSRAGMKQHDMARLFHRLLINLIRGSNCQSSHPPGHSSNGSGDLDQDWREWIVAEEKKRWLPHKCIVGCKSTIS